MTKGVLNEGAIHDSAKSTGFQSAVSIVEHKVNAAVRDLNGLVLVRIVHSVAVEMGNTILLQIALIIFIGAKCEIWLNWSHI